MDPDSITAETGLHPVDVGEPKSVRGEILHQARWAYNGGGKARRMIAHPRRKLDVCPERVSGAADVFKKYGSTQLVTWWCGHFQSS
jgi:hypothetical protein